MDLVPDHVLLQMFGFLGYEDLCLAARMTCRRWWTLSHDASLWDYLIVPDHLSNERFLMLVEQAQGSVEALDCTLCDNLTKDAFISMAANMRFPNLKKLCMPFITIEDEILVNLAKVCPLVEELENISAGYTTHPAYCFTKFPQLKSVYDSPTSVYGRIRNMQQQRDQRRYEIWKDDHVLVGQVCPNVENYYCSRGYNYMGDEGLELLASTYPKLKSLRLHYCALTDHGILRLTENTNGRITSFTLDKPGAVTDHGIKHIADGCPNLERIKINMCTEITSEAAQYLVKKCKHLQMFHFNNYSPATGVPMEDREDKYHLNDECLQEIAEHCPELTHLKVFYSSLVTHLGLVPVVLQCQNLSALMLYNCRSVNDQCLEAIAKIKFLKSLILVNCEGITPQAVLELVLTAPMLHCFTFYSLMPAFFDDMAEVGESIYEKISSVDLRPNVIKVLTLKGIGSGFLQLLTVLCPKLRTVSIKEGSWMNVRSIISVLKVSECLRVLDVQGMKDPDDSFFDAVGQFGLKLRQLAVGKLGEGVTQDALCRVLMTCPSLSTLSIDSIQCDINVDFLVYVAKRYHGGHCVMLGPTEACPDRQTELHFTPIKYLSSINCVAVE